MKSSFMCVVLCATLALVFTSNCPQGDASVCTGLTCDDPNEVVGCEHHICTCVPDHGQAGNGGTCSAVSDCTNNNCKHDETVHCIDGSCRCLKHH